MFDLAPYLAPLSRPMMERAAVLAGINIGTPFAPEHQNFDDYRSECIGFILRFRFLHSTVFKKIDDDMKEQRVSSEWFIDQIAKLAPQHGRITNETLSYWRRIGLLRDEGFNQPEKGNVAAILALRLNAPTRERGWVPIKTTPSLGKDLASWYCWRQDSPRASLLSCPVPLPEDLPTSAFLWTTWEGASWYPGWIRINDYGCARWARIRKDGIWDISEEELAMWDPDITPLGEDIASGLPITMHTLATLALLRLASFRLREKAISF